MFIYKGFKVIKKIFKIVIKSIIKSAYLESHKSVIKIRGIKYDNIFYNQT